MFKLLLIAALALSNGEYFELWNQSKYQFEWRKLKKLIPDLN